MARLPSLHSRKALIAVLIAALMVSSGCVGVVQQVDSKVDGSQPDLEHVEPHAGTQFHPIDEGHVYIVRLNNGTTQKFYAANLSTANISENATVLFNGRLAAKLLHQRIQEYRAENGKSETRLQPVLMSTARAKSHHQAVEGYYAHNYNKNTGNMPTGDVSNPADNKTIESFPEFISRGNTLSAYSNVYPQMNDQETGENLMRSDMEISKDSATNFTQRVVERAFTAWKNSPGHNRLMLSSKYTLVGYGFDVKRISATNSDITYKVYMTLHAAQPRCTGNGIHPFSDPCEAAEEFRETHNISSAS